MLPRNQPDRIRIVFDDHRLVANAGLLLPATLARHLGLRELVDHHLDLGGAPGRANTGDKLMTLVASAMAGGDCIDDADVLRTGGTACTLGGTVKAPSTLGTFLRSFRWGHVRQLDRVSRELPARAWAAGAGPGDGPFTIDLDSTICETYGLAKEGARHHGYTGKRGYHPLLAIAAGTGDVLMSRLREGRANTARGAAHFLRETVGRVATPGPTDDSRYGPKRVLHSWRGIRLPQDGCPLLHHHPPAQEPAQSHRGDTRGCLDSQHWMDGAADVAETTCTPFQSEPDAAPVRLIVRRLKPTPGSQPPSPPTAITASSPTGRGDARTGGRPSPPRRDRECHPRPQARCGVEPSPLAVIAAWLAVGGPTTSPAGQRASLGEQVVTTKTLRRRFFSLAGHHPLGAPPHTASAKAGLGKPSIVPWPDCYSLHGGGGNRPPSGQPNVPANSRQSGLRVPLAVLSPLSRTSQTVTLPGQLKTDSTPNRARTIALLAPR